MDDMSKITSEFIRLIRTIWDDDEFVLGMLTFADNDDDRQTIIDFINAGEDVDIETVSVLALELDRRRYGN